MTQDETKRNEVQRYFTELSNDRVALRRYKTEEEAEFNDTLRKQHMKMEGYDREILDATVTRFSDMFYGMGKKSARELIFELAKLLNALDIRNFDDVPHARWESIRVERNDKIRRRTMDRKQLP